MDERLYMNIALWLTSRTESVLLARFNEPRRDVPPTHETDDSTPLSERIYKENGHA